MKWSHWTLMNLAIGSVMFSGGYAASRCIRQSAKAIEPAVEVQAEEEAPASFEDATITEIKNLKQQVAELRWEIDDLKLRNRSPEELAEAMKAGKDHPESSVVVSKDYPKWRLPYGVYIDDERPAEVVAEEVERCKQGKGTVYMWLELPTKDDTKELRVYFTKVGYKDPKKK